jgi:hypothetical protein
MQERWNLDILYRGFDDEAFAADVRELEKAIG